MADAPKESTATNTTTQQESSTILPKESKSLDTAQKVLTGVGIVAGAIALVPIVAAVATGAAAVTGVAATVVLVAGAIGGLAAIGNAAISFMRGKFTDGGLDLFEAGIAGVGLAISNPLAALIVGGGALLFSIGRAIVGAVSASPPDVKTAGETVKQEQKEKALEKKDEPPYGKAYSSPDAAATAFAGYIYSSSLYVRHEYGAKIYSQTVDGVKSYYVSEPNSGGPHSVSYGGIDLPKGATYEATIHTHPNSNSFSSADKTNANNRGINSYVVGPNLSLQCYNVSDKTTSVVGTITSRLLTEAEKKILETEFRPSWDSHLDKNGNCNDGFNCGNMTWPTP